MVARASAAAISSPVAAVVVARSGEAAARSTELGWRTGTPHSNVAGDTVEIAATGGGTTVARVTVAVAARAAWTRIGPGPSSISTVPFVSVRKMRVPPASIRATVAGDG
ncbi:MAG: hypothetical protein A2V84_02860 [Chloroflexi bacterium RBG_16_70_13]|nr:MAG: hypothetical protein A2V84_02860 [Chloroflexi bacterium RBG_16_70_13]